MTKPEIVTRISQDAGITKKAANAALSSLVQAVHSALKQKNGKIRIANLGTFRVISLKARKGVNTRTGKPMTISAMRVPRFSSSVSLKDSVQKKKSRIIRRVNKEKYVLPVNPMIW